MNIYRIRCYAHDGSIVHDLEVKADNPDDAIGKYVVKHLRITSVITNAESRSDTIRICPQGNDYDLYFKGTYIGTYPTIVEAIGQVMLHFGK